MKKGILFVLAGLLFLTMFNACKDSNELDLDEGMAFSKLSVELQKQKIETNNTGFADTLDVLTNCTPVVVMQYLPTLFDKSQQHSAAIESFAESLTENPSLAVRMAGLHLMDRLAGDLSSGEYAYNTSTRLFDKTKDLVDKLIIRFPASASVTVNNAVYTLEYTKADMKLADANTFYPEKINCSLAVSSVSQIMGSFSAQYNSEGIAHNVKETLLVGDYSFVTSINYTNKKLKKTFEAKDGSVLIFKNAGEINGDISKTTLQAKSSGNAVTKVATSVQVMNMTIISGTDFYKDLVRDMKVLESTASDAKTYATKKAELLNLYMVCYGYFVDQNKKFANIQYFVVENTDNPLATTYDVIPRFVLKDGSPLEIDDIYTDGLADIAEYTDRLLSDSGLMSDAGAENKEQ